MTRRTPTSRPPHLPATALSLTATAALAACVNPVGFGDIDVAPGQPRLFYVGTDPWLTYGTGEALAPLQITVGGCNLDKAKLHVLAEATVPFRPNEVELIEVDAATALVQIAARYFERASDRDQLTLTISAEPKDPELHARRSIVRHMMLREAQVYRDTVIPTITPLNDVRAFPMSSEVVRQIFGDDVDDNYYVVAIRVFNRSDADRVITTGMITAHGRLFALGPDIRQKSGHPRTPILSKPVQISPVRSSVAYVNVDDRRPYRFRNVAFRLFSFAGAVGTGVTTAFGANEAWQTSLSLFTGIAIPELDKLWPDTTSRHLANIVTFGMPDVVKVPSGASAGGVLFFAKRELHSMVDQFDYVKITEASLSDLRVQAEQPPQFLAGLEVNGLNVFFENAVTPQELEKLKRVPGSAPEATPAATASEQLEKIEAEVERLWLVDRERYLRELSDLFARLDQLPIPAVEGEPKPLAEVLPNTSALHREGPLRVSIANALAGLQQARTTLKTTHDALVAALDEARQQVVRSLRADDPKKLAAALERARDALGALRQDLGRSRALDASAAEAERIETAAEQALSGVEAELRQLMKDVDDDRVRATIRAFHDLKGVPRTV